MVCSSVARKAPELRGGDASDGAVRRRLVRGVVAQRRHDRLADGGRNRVLKARLAPSGKHRM